MSHQFRAMAAFEGSCRHAPVRATRYEAEHDAIQFIEDGARLVVVLQHLRGFWQLRTPSDLLIPAATRARLDVSGE